ncbi:LuxR C-terminal-related transcriptional regulator [Paracoccus gahaiensis]|nr:LuxR C-terminal-related transcriptional regulator [Paracoccus gahaiensis]
MDLRHPIRRFWTRASLATRFAVVGGLVLSVFMGLAGWLLTDHIRQVVVRNTATAAALYMDSFLHPLVEDHVAGTAPSPAMRRALSEVLPATVMGDRILSYKVLAQGGLVIAASNPDLIGRSFPPSEELAQAWSGRIAAIFEEEDLAEHALSVPLLKIYSPIRADWTGEIIAVAELYVADPALKADLSAARAMALAGVGGGGLALGLILYAIVRQGSHTIDRQRRDLDRRLADMRRLSEHNGQLRLWVQQAAGRAAATTEGGLRQIARGLVLPELSHLPAGSILRLAIEAHQARCPTPVALVAEAAGDPSLTPGLRICLFRFVQEGLNNAARHAGSAGMAVRLEGGVALLRVTVMLTVSEDGDAVFAALEGGARGYLLKGIGGAELVATLEPVMQGESHVAPSLAARMLARLRSPASSLRDGLALLTPREEEVLRLVSEGLSNKEIARRTDVQERTITHHMTQILQKLHLRNSTEAALLAQREWRTG